MKKIFLSGVIIFLMLSSDNASAQKDSVAIEKATKERGYTALNKGEGEITIYKYQHMAHSPKEAEKYKPEYFFTTASTNVLQPLTTLNIKKAFPENHPFHDAIDATFDSEQDLIKYDTFHKMYKLNWLLHEHH